MRSSALKQLITTSLFLFIIHLVATAQQNSGKEWYDAVSKTWYNIHNDNKAVYIQLTLTDPLQQKKIIENGVEIWVDAKGKRKKNMGVAFPLTTTSPAGMQQPPAAPQQPQGDKQSPNESLKERIGQLREMKVTGFASDLNGVQNSNHPSGLQTSLQFSNDTLVYLAVIPFQTMGRPVGFNTPISIGIVQKGRLSQMQGPGGGMPDFGGEPGGGDGMAPPPGPPPGGMGGPDDDEDDSNRRQLWEDNEVWYRFVLK